MTFEGYFSQQDDILKNKLGISDPALLREVEETIVSLRMAELISQPPRWQKDFKYLKAVHRKLFSDIYSFAGKVRTVDIAKGKSAFCYVQNIDSEQHRIFSNMNQLAWNKLTKNDFADKLAVFSADLNALHPFREGNGRALRTYLILFAARYGYYLDFSAVEHESLMEADIRAFYGDLNMLKAIYRDILITAN